MLKHQFCKISDVRLSQYVFASEFYHNITSSKNVNLELSVPVVEHNSSI